MRHGSATTDEQGARLAERVGADAVGPQTTDRANGDHGRNIPNAGREDEKQTRRKIETLQGLPSVLLRIKVAKSGKNVTVYQYNSKLGCIVLEVRLSLLI